MYLGWVCILQAIFNNSVNWVVFSRRELGQLQCFHNYSTSPLPLKILNVKTVILHNGFPQKLTLFSRKTKTICYSRLFFPLKNEDVQFLHQWNFVSSLQLNAPKSLLCNQYWQLSLGLLNCSTLAWSPSFSLQEHF